MAWWAIIISPSFLGLSLSIGLPSAPCIAKLFVVVTVNGLLSRSMYPTKHRTCWNSPLSQLECFITRVRQPPLEKPKMKGTGVGGPRSIHSCDPRLSDPSASNAGMKIVVFAVDGKQVAFMELLYKHYHLLKNNSCRKACLAAVLPHRARIDTLLPCSKGLMNRLHNDQASSVRSFSTHVTCFCFFWSPRGGVYGGDHKW
jgi:hypothetical protein